MADCSEKVCPGLMQLSGGGEVACSGRGTCNGAKECVCEPGWAGTDCSDQACPAGCSSHGLCLNGTCFCANGFTGDACDIITCVHASRTRRTLRVPSAHPLTDVAPLVRSPTLPSAAHPSGVPSRRRADVVLTL